MKILGIDIGNSKTETSEGINFKTRVTDGVIETNKSDLKVEYLGKKHTIGANSGRLNLGDNKYNKIDFDLAFLTAIAQSFEEEEIICNVVAGLPIEKYHNDNIKNALKDKLVKYNRCEIKISQGDKAIKKIITVNDADVFMESGIPFLNREYHRNLRKLVLDFGGSTTDISLWDGLRLEDFRTYKDGMISLSDKIAKAINLKYGSNFNGNYCENLIGSNYTSINQEDKDISFIDDIINGFVTNLTSFIYQNFPIDDVQEIEGIGGGALALKEYLQKEYKHIIISEKAEFKNALTYKAVGEMIW